MEIKNKTIEERIANGEFDVGEVVIEEDEEMEIPVHVAENESIAQGYPELVFYTGNPENQKPKAVEEPAPKPLFAYFVKAGEAQKRLRNLADYLFPEPKLSYRLANAFGRTTEKDRIGAFGNYFADLLGSQGYVNPAQFIVKAEIALMNLKSGKEGGRPIRKSIRQALSGKNEQVYDSIRQKLPEIARAVATTGFALELSDICADANRAGKSAFEYAQDIRSERQIDELARQANYELCR